MKLTGFRAHDVRMSTLDLLSDLRAHPVPNVVLRSPHGKDASWYALDVDEDLLELLRKSGTVESLLALKKGKGARIQVVPTSQNVARIAEGLRGSSPVVLLDSGGMVCGVAAPAAQPRATAKKRAARPKRGAGALPEAAPQRAAATSPAPATLYPGIDAPKGNVVAPGETLQYAVRLSGDPALASGAPFDVVFPDGAETLDVIAELVSTDFAVLPGRPYFQKFTVDRDLKVTPEKWEIEVTAVGDRPSYRLDVVLHAAGKIAGSLSVTATRRGAPFAAPPRSYLDPLTLPVTPGRGLVVLVAERAGPSFEFIAYRDGERVLDRVEWSGPGDDYFPAFEDAKDLTALEELGAGLRNDLPDAVVELFESAGASHIPVFIVSNGRIAPFEATQLAPSTNGPFLGVAVDVLRWIYSRTPEVDVIPVHRAACLRPRYQGTDALPDAEKEEQDLQTALAKPVHAGTRAEFDAKILSNGDIELVHFAGHAQAAPALLKLEGGETLAPHAFHPKYPLMSQGRPFVFVNACQAGLGSGLGASIVDNLVKTLLKNGSRSVVAPYVSVHTAAAHDAACTFYAAASTETIGEAVRLVREKAMSAPDGQRATYLSYAAFATPGMKLSGIAPTPPAP